MHADRLLRGLHHFLQGIQAPCQGAHRTLVLAAGRQELLGVCVASLLCSVHHLRGTAVETRVQIEQLDIMRISLILAPTAMKPLPEHTVLVTGDLGACHSTRRLGRTTLTPSAR